MTISKEIVLVSDCTQSLYRIPTLVRDITRIGFRNFRHSCACAVLVESEVWVCRRRGREAESHGFPARLPHARCRIGHSSFLHEFPVDTACHFSTCQCNVERRRWTSSPSPSDSSRPCSRLYSWSKYAISQA